MIHANFAALCFIEPELLSIEVLHCGNRDFRPYLLLWPWLDDLHIRTWPVFPGDIPHVQIFHFANAVVATDSISSHLTVSSSASWSSCSPPSNFVNGHASTIQLSLLLVTVTCRWFGRVPFMYVKAFDSYRLTDRQTNAAKLCPRRFASGQQLLNTLQPMCLKAEKRILTRSFS